MTASVATICDPRCHRLDDAIQQAKLAAEASPRFELDLARFLQVRCLANQVNLPTLFQGLEILGGMLEQSRLVPFLRPFLRSRDPRIASKSALIVGRQSRNLTWLMRIMNEEKDDRVRANLIESFWRRREPEVEQLLKHVHKDANHRVAANAVYGLYLLGSESWSEGLDTLLGSIDPGFRRAAIWVLRSAEGIEATGRLKPLIRDPDPNVRHATFNALIYLRESGAKNTTDAAAL